jgi:hypothetical protein
MVVDRSSPGRTVGLTRFVVLGEFLCEFSIIIEAKPSQTSEALMEAAEADMDMFMGALVKAPQLPPPMPPQLPPSRV